MGKRAQGWAEHGRNVYENRLASFYFTLGDYDRALVEAERAIESGFRPLEALSTLLTVRGRASVPAAVAAVCDRLAVLALEEPRGLGFRTRRMWRACGRPSQALADFARATELAPDWADPYYARAVVRDRARPQQGVGGH